MTIPQIIASFVKNGTFQLIVSKYINYTTTTGLLLYVILIILFTYFYTFMQLKPKEMAENLNKNGGYIPGVRPGEETTNYVSKVLKRITIVRGFLLEIIEYLPLILDKVYSLSNVISISGTGLLIVVGVALETYKQLESQLKSRTYENGRKNRRRRF